MKTIGAIFLHFLYLGCYSFGGPVAHIGYFHQHFVVQKKWLAQEQYANWVSLCHLLPGPSSSQVGFCIGVEKAGVLGGVAAFIGFTLPSFFIMYTLAILGNTWVNHPNALIIIHALTLLAMVVVAQAIISVYRLFCRHYDTIAIAVVSFIACLGIQYFWQQMLIFLAAALIGIVQGSPDKSHAIKMRITIWPLALFLILAILPWLINTDIMQLFADFFHAGGTVMGGGHVVLPILKNSVQHLNEQQLLLGYSAAQGIPGPMFTIASYLGAHLYKSTPLLGAIIATIAIFLPGFLFVLSVHKHWHWLQQHARIQKALQAINAAMVGLLASVFYHPIATTAITNVFDIIAVVLSFILLHIRKVAIFWIFIMLLLYLLVFAYLPLYLP